jgi:hypothetical protein
MDPALVVECAESIAFLHVLHKVPQQPSVNPIPDFQLQQSDGHLLAFEKERHLASILAFLSSTRTDSKRIPALYVRENQQEMRLEVILAVNEEQHLSGSQARQEMKGCLESISAALAVSLKGR